MPCQKSERKLSSTLALLFRILPNSKILLLSLLKVNDKIIIIIIWQIAAEPAQVLLW
jgi:hypothetical protein